MGNAVGFLGSITQDSQELENLIRQMDEQSASTVLAVLGAARGAAPSEI